MNITELKYELSRLGVSEEAYSLGTGLPNANEQYCLVNLDGMWELYYAEKGTKGSIELFADEADACQRFLENLTSDSSVFRLG